MGYAYFRKYPFRIENLNRVHLLTERRPYVIVTTVTLSRIDYENFVTDLTVERWFLGVNAPLCQEQQDGVLMCILVRRRGRRDGVLVVPDQLGFVIWAALLPYDKRDPE